MNGENGSNVTKIKLISGHIIFKWTQSENSGANPTRFGGTGTALVTFVTATNGGRLTSGWRRRIGTGRWSVRRWRPRWTDGGLRTSGWYRCRCRRNARRRQSRRAPRSAWALGCWRWLNYTQRREDGLHGGRRLDGRPCRGTHQRRQNSRHCWRRLPTTQVRLQRVRLGRRFGRLRLLLRRRHHRTKHRHWRSSWSISGGREGSSSAEPSSLPRHSPEGVQEPAAGPPRWRSGGRRGGGRRGRHSLSSRRSSIGGFCDSWGQKDTVETIHNNMIKYSPWAFLTSIS